VNECVAKEILSVSGDDAWQHLVAACGGMWWRRVVAGEYEVRDSMWLVD
jgi:hypothetical protein